jgi:hypothetical protein
MNMVWVPRFLVSGRQGRLFFVVLFVCSGFLSDIPNQMYDTIMQRYLFYSV